MAAKSSLHEAVEEGDIAKVKMLLAQGEDVNAVNHGITPLHLAVEHRNLDIMRELLVAGSRVDELSGSSPRTRFTPLDYAVQIADRASAQLLLDHGAKVNLSSEQIKGSPPLLFAAGGGEVELVKLLLARGADVKTTSVIGQTPLHVAAMGGHAEIVELLLSNNADPTAKNLSGETPLMQAIAAGHDSVAKLLAAPP